MASVGEGIESKSMSNQTRSLTCDNDLFSPELLARAMGGLEERLQAAMERQTETLLTALHGGHKPTPARQSTSLEVSKATTLQRSLTRQDCTGVLGVRRWGSMHADEIDQVQDIVVQPDAPGANQEPAPLDHVRWQWQSTAGPWKDYNDSAQERLEEAFREGETHLRLKSGLSGKVPMEVFFVNMVQRDPQSRRVRRVRRFGPALTLRERALRHGRALLRYIATGKPMYESLEAYRSRQAALEDLENDRRSERGRRGKVSALNFDEFRQNSLRHTCKRLVKSTAFSTFGILVLLAQCWWIWYSTDPNAGIPLYDQSLFSKVIEHFFCVFFMAEFTIQIIALRQRWYWYFNQWLCLDAVCVVSSTLDVLVLPPLAVVTGHDLSEGSRGEMLRMLRLVKLFRIGRIFGHSPIFSAIIKGMVQGMRSAAFILALLAMAVFAFAVLMRANSEHELLEPYFGTLDKAMVTLLARGLFLDGIHDLIWTMVDVQLFMPLICFGFFMYVTFFGLMSMLIGAFCSVADEVHKDEEDRIMTDNIRSSLKGIVECYTEDTGDDHHMMVNQRVFMLLLQNPDVHNLLKSSRTDIPGLIHVMNVAFAGSKEGVSFSDLLDLVVHCREGKSACVSDVAHLEGFALQNFERLENMIGTLENAQEEPEDGAAR